MPRSLTLVASRSVVSAMPRKRAASSRRNRAFIVHPFRIVGIPKGGQRGCAEFADNDGGSMECMDDGGPAQCSGQPTLTIWGHRPIGGYPLADAPQPALAKPPLLV